MLWHHDTGYSGGGGTTAVLHGGRLYAEAWTFKVLDPATGQMTGSYINHNGSDYSQPAFAGDARDLPARARPDRRGPDGATRWSFAAAAQRPITAGGYAYTVVGEFGIDDPAGLVAIDLSSGAPVWCADLGIRAYPDGHAGPVSGGNGLIVVPVDDRLVAYGNGGTGSTCGADERAGAGSAPAPRRGSAPAGSAVEVSSPAGSGPRITLRAARTKLVLGQRTRLTGVVSGVAAGRRPARADRGRRSSVRSLPHARARPHAR